MSRVKQTIPISLLVLAGLFAGGCAPKNKGGVIRPNLECKTVAMGRIGFNQGPIRSNYVSWCTTVILDYGGTAFLAHALPGESDNQDYPGLINVNNVVMYLVRESRKRGFDPRSSEAIINTSTQEYLEVITNDLVERGIPIRITIKEGGPSRNIIYLPTLNRMEIEFNKPGE